MNSYVHVLDADGKRITSIVDDMLSPVGETELLEVAKTQYPDAAGRIDDFKEILKIGNIGCRNQQYDSIE